MVNSIYWQNNFLPTLHRKLAVATQSHVNASCKRLDINGRIAEKETRIRRYVALALPAVVCLCQENPFIHVRVMVM